MTIQGGAIRRESWEGTGEEVMVKVEQQLNEGGESDFLNSWRDVEDLFLVIC